MLLRKLLRPDGDCHPQTRPWGGRGGRPLCGRDCADGCGKRCARKNLLTFGLEIFSEDKARKLCSLHKKNLAQVDEAWIQTSSLKCYLGPRYSSVFATSYLVMFFSCRNMWADNR